MRGSAMGLSLLTGIGLGESVLVRPLIRLFMMIFGSAEDPSCFTLFSPNMVVVTELLRRPTGWGKLCTVPHNFLILGKGFSRERTFGSYWDGEGRAVRLLELLPFEGSLVEISPLFLSVGPFTEDAAILVTAGDDGGAASFDGVLELDFELGLWYAFAGGTIGWGKLCTAPHNFLILGKGFSRERTFGSYRGGGGRADAAFADVWVDFRCGSGCVLAAIARFESIVLGAKLFELLLFVEILVGISVFKVSPFFLSL